MRAHLVQRLEVLEERHGVVLLGDGDLEGEGAGDQGLTLVHIRAQLEQLLDTFMS
jgi:hypothetical protein